MTEGDSDTTSAATLIEHAEATLESVKMSGNDPIGSVGMIAALTGALKKAQEELEETRKNLESYCEALEWIKAAVEAFGDIPEAQNSG